MCRGLAGGGTDQPDVIPGRVVLCRERTRETDRGDRGNEGNGKIGEKRRKRWRTERNETERKGRRKIAETTLVREG